MPPVVCTVTLKHHFEALGGNIVQITVEDTEVKVTGGLGGILVGLASALADVLLVFQQCNALTVVHSQAVRSCTCTEC